MLHTLLYINCHPLIPQMIIKPLSNQFIRCKICKMNICFSSFWGIDVNICLFYEWMQNVGHYKIWLWYQLWYDFTDKFACDPSLVSYPAILILVITVTSGSWKLGGAGWPLAVECRSQGQIQDLKKADRRFTGYGAFPQDLCGIFRPF